MLFTYKDNISYAHECPALLNTAFEHVQVVPSCDDAVVGIECTKSPGELFTNPRKGKMFITYDMRLEGKLTGHCGEYDVTGSWKLHVDSLEDTDDWTWSATLITPGKDADGHEAVKKSLREVGEAAKKAFVELTKELIKRSEKAAE